MTVNTLESSTCVLALTEGPHADNPSAPAVAGPDVKVLFIGAGNINFGSEEGPWNHSKRLEEKLGMRLKVIGIVDPAVKRAEAVLAAKSLALAAPAYAEAIVYPSVSTATAALVSSPPDLVILGCPPAFRGTSDPSQGFNTEEQLTDAFPAAALFVEKPISTHPVDETHKVAELLESRKANLVSVGYMLRYSAAVQKMKQIIAENKLEVMMTSARYVMSYEHSLKLGWWNKSVDCGPIVEQASEFEYVINGTRQLTNSTLLRPVALLWWRGGLGEHPGALDRVV